jgi:SAM-dependent methyltransferase
MGLYSRQLRPRLHDRLLDNAAAREVRDQVCAGLAGDVLEIGFGSGLNLAHLPSAVTGVWAVEPSATAVQLSAARRDASPVPVELAGDDAQVLPFAEHRFDAALCTWVLCSVPDRGRALAEVARVLRPGGTLHFVEHGLAPDPRVVRWQRRANPLSRALSGCELDVDVAGLLAASPLTVAELTSWYLPGAPRSTGFLSAGRAVA